MVEPALALFDFDVVRADKIAGPGPITTEIVELVQNAELCVIDLTGKNANVFYECGRRHETGKPFVQLARKGEDLPFDVAGIRTIFYDLNTPRSVKEAFDQLQRFVAEFAQSGFGTSAGSSLSTVATALERVENKVDRLLASPAGGRREAKTRRRRGRFPTLPNPRQAFLDAVMEGDAAEAERHIPRLKEMVGATSGEFIAAVGTLADAGSPVGGTELHELLSAAGSVAKLEPSSLKAAVSSLIEYYLARDQEEEGIERVSPIIELLLDDADRTDDDRAFFFNQLQKLCYGSGRYEEAQKYGEQAVRLQPSQSSYHYNMSLVYEKRGLLDLAERSVDEYMKSERSQNDPTLWRKQLRSTSSEVGSTMRNAGIRNSRPVDEGSQRTLRLMMDEEVQRLLNPIA